MRRVAKVDLNQPRVVADLRKMGVRILSLATVGDGCPDLLCLFRDRLWLVELKNPERSRITEAQKSFMERWPVIVAETAEQAFKEIMERAR